MSLNKYKLMLLSVLKTWTHNDNDVEKCTMWKNVQLNTKLTIQRGVKANSISTKKKSSRRPRRQ